MIEKLVLDLPEIYQPIYGHMELSTQTSRNCEDRLEKIVDIYSALQRHLGRPLRILDLGCAQGFFSFNLAKLGATVHGVDYLDKNIAVCECLARENPDINVTFETCRIEDVVKLVEVNKYDMILGLSVFHHIVYEYAIPYVVDILEKLAKSQGVLILEFALREEPVYWGLNQPENPIDLINGIAFVYELGKFQTHLSKIKRPLYIASNKYIILNNVAYNFDRYTNKSNVFAIESGADKRYYFNSELVFKLYYHNGLDAKLISDHLNEVERLKNGIEGIKSPALIDCGLDDKYSWIIIERITGKTLFELISQNELIDKEKVISEVLNLVCKLEESNLYHNDLRTWNIIIDKNGRPNLIDYGSICESKFDLVWPKNIFLSFFIFVNEVLNGRIVEPNPIREVHISLANQPEPYKSWGRKFLSQPADDWNFALIRDLYNDAKVSGEFFSENVIPNEQWVLSIENALNETLVYAKGLHVGLREETIKVKELYGLLSDISNKISSDDMANDLIKKEFKTLKEELKSYNTRQEKLIKLHISNQINSVLHNNVLSKDVEIGRLKEELSFLSNYNHQNYTKLQETTEELNKIKKSNTWRSLQKIRNCGNLFIYIRKLESKAKAFLKGIITRIVLSSNIKLKKFPRLRSQIILFAKHLGVYEYILRFLPLNSPHAETNLEYCNTVAVSSRVVAVIGHLNKIFKS